MKMRPPGTVPGTARKGASARRPGYWRRNFCLAGRTGWPLLWAPAGHFSSLCQAARKRDKATRHNGGQLQQSGRLYEATGRSYKACEYRAKAARPRLRNTRSTPDWLSSTVQPQQDRHLSGVRAVCWQQGGYSVMCLAYL
eukprot:scaffold1809_cov386-Prasinococcus_capsulatus_cf.AAC.40